MRKKKCLAQLHLFLNGPITWVKCYFSASSWTEPGECHPHCGAYKAQKYKVNSKVQAHVGIEITDQWGIRYPCPKKKKKKKKKGGVRCPSWFLLWDPHASITADNKVLVQCQERKYYMLSVGVWVSCCDLHSETCIAFAKPTHQISQDMNYFHTTKRKKKKKKWIKVKWGTYHVLGFGTMDLINLCFFGLLCSRWRYIIRL